MSAPVVKRLVYKLGRRAYDGKRCEAQVRESTARWRTHRGADTQCDLSALYLIDTTSKHTGKVLSHHFCARHAGDHLIKTLIVGEQLVERSTRADQSALTKFK